MGSSEAKCMELGDGILRKINQNQKDQTYAPYHMVQILIFPVWCVYVTLVSGEFAAYCVCAHMCVHTDKEGRGQYSVSSLNCSSSLFFETGSHTEPEV